MPKSIEDGFEEFLKRLSPLSSEYRKSISHKKSVKSCLRKKFGCSHFFETGSFGNKTGVKHYSDTDYFAVCTIFNLKKNSSQALLEVKKALQFTFHKTAPRIKVNLPSVTIPFGKYASENLEITPCIYQTIISTPVGRKKAYGIPNGRKGWMLSSPGAHNAYVSKHNKRLQYRLKPLIILVKAWNFFNNVGISSFYLEVRITKLLEDKKKIDYVTDLYGTIKKLYDIQLADIQDPMKVSGLIKACKSDIQKKSSLSKLKTAYSRAEKAYLERKKNPNACFYWWKKFYGKEFPSR